MKSKTLITTLLLIFGLNAQDAKRPDYNLPKNSVFIGASGFSYAPRDLGRYSANKIVVESFTGNGLSPIYLKYEYRKTKFSMGCNLAYTTGTMTAKIKDTTDPSGTKFYTDKIKRSSTSILFRMNHYFNTNHSFQPYIGLGIGIRSVKYVDYTPNYNPVSLKNAYTLGLETTLGAKLNITGNLFLYAEIGIAKSIGQLGVVYAFNTKK